MRSKQQIQAELKKSADNAVALHVNMLVIYTDDKNNEVLLKTTSEPWMLGHGGWVINLAGKSGGIDCARVVPVKG